MSNIIKAGATVLTSSVLAYYGSSYLQKHHGPTGRVFKAGQRVTVNGEELVVIGYFGAAESTMRKIDLKTRELYYTSKKKVAQQYARDRASVLARTNPNETPQTAVVVGTALPKESDHNCPRFSSEGGPAPLSPNGLQRLNVQLVHHENVNASTASGITANINRLIKELRSSSNRKT